MDTIVYHGDCPDGFTAAYILFTRKYGKAKLVPATYGKKLDDNDFINKDVIVVDFSWKRDECLRLKQLAKSMIILDHHKTAEEELKNLDFCVFDMNRSGAQLAWDQVSTLARPWWVNYVADRDLWQWKLIGSRAVSAFIMTLSHTTEAYSKLESFSLENAINAGMGAEAHVNHYVEKVCAQAYSGLFGNGYKVSICNAPYTNCADVGNELCKRGADVGLVWFVRGDQLMQFSLRSIGDIDVSVIAKDYGGGGHKNAAGFQVSIEEGLNLLFALTDIN